MYPLPFHPGRRFNDGPFPYLADQSSDKSCGNDDKADDKKDRLVGNHEIAPEAPAIYTNEHGVDCVMQRESVQQKTRVSESDSARPICFLVYFSGIRYQPPVRLYI